MSETKRIGLWKNVSGKGTTYLSGSDKDAGVRYMVFKDDETGVRKLVTKPLADSSAPLKNVTVFAEAETSEGVPYFKGEGCAIFGNDFYEEGSNKPEFNLLLNG